MEFHDEIQGVMGDSEEAFDSKDALKPVKDKLRLLRFGFFTFGNVGKL